jgi:hypothetical protein
MGFIRYVLYARGEGEVITTIRKDVVIILLLTFCLISVLFLIPVSSSGTKNSYDPWSDINGDGIIDVTDVQNVVGLYGGIGDPTRNVNVTNWPPTQPSSNLVQFDLSIPWAGVPSTTEFEPWIPVSGYTRAWIWLSALWGSSASSGTYTVTLTLTRVSWGVGPSQMTIQMLQTPTSSQSSSISIQVINGVITSSTTAAISEDSYFSIKAPYINWLIISLSSTVSSGSVPVTLCVYLQNQ